MEDGKPDQVLVGTRVLTGTEQAIEKGVLASSGLVEPAVESPARPTTPVPTHIPLSLPGCVWSQVTHLPVGLLVSYGGVR